MVDCKLRNDEGSAYLKIWMWSQALTYDTIVALEVNKTAQVTESQFEETL
jgi:hypothetical protein